MKQNFTKYSEGIIGKMVVFEDKEFEIAMVTYNRANYVEKWIDLCYDEIKKRNITLSIYDSSTNDLTKNLVEKKYKDIDYHKINSDVSIGYKPMIPILKSDCKYLWVSGDSRWHDFDVLDNTVFKSAKENIDFILISASFYDEYDGYVFTSKQEFLEKCLISTTCIGLSIYKTRIFDTIKNDDNLLKEYDKKYKNNYGFAWMGYFYECFANGEYKAIYHKIEINDVIKQKKKQFWAKRFYECWVENLCDLLDNFPICYVSNKNMPRKVWEDMELDSIHYTYVARISGGLTSEIYDKYLNNGMLDRVTNKKEKIKVLLDMPMFLLEIIYVFDKIYRKLVNIIR